MRISAIQNYYHTNNTYLANRKAKPVQQPVAQPVQEPTVQSTNYALQTGMKIPPQINFTGTISPLALAKKFPLEDRLADLFSVSIPGDIIVAGKDLKSAQKLLKENVKDLGIMIKRFFFVPEDNLEGAAVFTRNQDDTLEIFNPNKKPIYIHDTAGKKSFLNKGDSAYIISGDSVKIGDRFITMKREPKANLSFSRHIFAQAFDRTQEAKKAVEKANNSTLTSLTEHLKKAKAKPITFADIGGQDKVIQELKRGILYPIEYPEAYQNSIPNHGFILYGPPGTGKTLIAQALANETKASFVKLNGLEMESKWVGESEQNWRNLFAQARENQPSIIFIDEFDAVAKKRGSADVYGDKVVNQLLTLMSDVEKNGDDIYVITATNNHKALDEAITRSGRFGKHIEVKAPDTQEAISQIFDIHTKNKVLAPDLDKASITKKLLQGKATGADIAHIVNSANENAFERSGIYAKMEDGTFTNEDLNNLRITNEDFNKAIDDFLNQNKGTKRAPIGFNK